MILASIKLSCRFLLHQSAASGHLEICRALVGVESRRRSNKQVQRLLSRLHSFTHSLCCSLNRTAPTPAIESGKADVARYVRGFSTPRTPPLLPASSKLSQLGSCAGEVGNVGV